MLELLFLIVGALALFFWTQNRHGRKLLLDISTSIREGNSLLLERSIFLSKEYPIELCQKALDENANRINKLELQSDRTTHTFNEILGGMLDGAMILDRDHIITFVNYSTMKNFSLDQRMEGRRLEAFIDSFEILDLIDQLGRGLPPGKAEFTFRRNGTIKDFEVAIALLSSFRTESNDVYLLLFREVTEIKRADRLRKDFVANASHELRTPVTVIKGFAETLVETPILPDSQRSSFISKIHKNSLRLQALVDDLLSLSELEGAEEAFQPTNNKLCEVIRGIDLYIKEKPYMESSKLRFLLTEEKDGFPFDAIKMAIAISNLIDNAFKYAISFTMIEVSTILSVDKKTITCSVRDDGNGIPPKDLERIFERFYVVDKGRSREKGGTGLGLSIVKHVAEGHGGQVFAKSKLGEGTTFSIELPRRQKSSLLHNWRTSVT
jgi:two-component system phosphate regulon sensor histidine kinase PhoR